MCWILLMIRMPCLTNLVDSFGFEMLLGDEIAGKTELDFSFDGLINGFCNSFGGAKSGDRHTCVVNVEETMTATLKK